MDSEKYMTFFKLFVPIALIVSLIINFNLSSRLGELESTISSLSSNQHNIINNVNDQTNQVQAILNDFKEEQSLISFVHTDFRPKESAKDQMEAAFKWRVKELDSNSEVIFHYAIGDNKEWTSLSPDEIEKGLYQVNFPLEISLEPQWEVGLSITGSNTKEESKQEIDERMDKENRQKSLNYYVTVTTDDTVKSGEVHTEHLGYYGTNYYGIIQTDINIHDKTFSASLVNHGPDPTSHVIEEAYLLIYDNEKLKEEKKMKAETENLPPDDSIRSFHLDEEKKSEDMRLAVKVVYSDGAVFEKEVY
ncbi:hypothetical protein [Pseudalkalibacillus caeni]|uniref:Uncharacterized protein n=1 Tax=Exobacillus caeni TaxID=2574798 RepID=A0A5R9F7H1_9BACL|nr:hypothetical protein [Pseudalkalibacillus caeni]TLS36454.1 hypothetical protein FCL54_14615 [Pseudalkalibacillus caeni]